MSNLLLDSGALRHAPALFTTLVAFSAISSSATAQQPGKVYRLGQIGPGPADCKFPPSDAAKGTPWEGLPLAEADIALRLGLQGAGWKIGQTLLIERRCVPTTDQADAIAAGLSKLEVDAYLVASAPITLAVRKVAGPIPVVFTGVPDPVAAGFVDSLGHPGGNLTGLSAMQDELVAKRIELIRELLPAAKELAVLLDLADPVADKTANEIETAADRFGLTLRRYAVRRPDEIDGAFAAMAGRRPDLLVVGTGGMFFVERARIAALAGRDAIPTSCAFGYFVEAGCLMSYAANWPEMARRAASYLDRIFKGANPADLPVEQPSTLELTINLATAKRLGITIPPPIMARADRMIE